VNGTPLHEFIFLGVFFALVFVVPIIVIWLSYKPSVDFDATTLWTHQGRVDKFAVIILGTWWLHSCSIVMWTLLRTIQTQDYLTYQLWAIPIIAKMLAPKGDDNPPAKT